MILVWKQSLYFIGRSLIHDFSFSGVICIYCPVLVILVWIGHIVSAVDVDGSLPRVISIQGR